MTILMTGYHAHTEVFPWRQFSVDLWRYLECLVMWGGFYPVDQPAFASPPWHFALMYALLCTKSGHLPCLKWIWMSSAAQKSCAPKPKSRHRVSAKICCRCGIFMLACLQNADVDNWRWAWKLNGKKQNTSNLESGAWIAILSVPQGNHPNLVRHVKAPHPLCHGIVVCAESKPYSPVQYGVYIDIQEV